MLNADNSQHLAEWSWPGWNIEEDNAIIDIDAQLKKIAMGGHYKLRSTTVEAGVGVNVSLRSLNKVFRRC
jgi:hypothetical protein